MVKYTLAFKLGNKELQIEMDISRKAIISVRDSLRIAGIEADIIIKQEPKILD